MGPAAFHILDSLGVFNLVIRQKVRNSGYCIVGDGNATGLTIGHIAGMVSSVCGAEGMEPIELGIYNVDREMVFLKEGDFGSLVA